MINRAHAGPWGRFVLLILLLMALHARAAQAQVQQQQRTRPTERGAAPPFQVTEQSSGTTMLLQAVHAVDQRVVWASGHGGVVLRTLDGGARWERRPVPDADSLQFRDVHATGPDTAWILAAGNGDRSRVYRTTDGGASWSLQFRNADSAAFYDCLTFLDSRRGIAFGDATAGRTRILRTDDGGARWTLLDSTSVPAPLPGEGAFAASGLCVAAADSMNVFVATGAPGARLLHSADGGLHWRVEDTPFVRGVAAGMTAIAFDGLSRAIAVGANIDRLRTDTSHAVVGTSSDGGRTWSMRGRPPLPGALAGVTWVPGVSRETVVAVGFGGAFVSTDEARTWHTVTDTVTTGVAAAGRTVWIGGGGGRILRLDFP